MSENACPLVTIAVPTYNRADRYLRQAVESALDQTYPNVEVIVSDNCSADNTEALIKGYSAPRLRYFRQVKNIGANNNFNFCVEQAKGDYFLLLQDDDLIDCDLAEVCMQAAGHNTDIGIIRTGTRVIDSDGKVLKESPNRVGGLSTADFFMGWFRGKTSLYLCSTLFNARRLKEIGGFRSKHNLFQDDVATAQLAARFGRVDVQEVKASFRRHGAQNTVLVKVRNWCEDSHYLLDIMCGLVPEAEAPLIRREGTLYFSKTNYNFARYIKPPIERWATYWVIYREFDYRYSPFYFFVYRKNLRRIWHLVRKVKQVLAKPRLSGTEQA